MTAKNTATLSKDELLELFLELVEEKKKQDAKVATKEEQAVRAKDRSIVDAASQYSVESIVKGLADLQLSFGTSVDALIARLMEESARLDELRKAIQIETAHAKYVNDVKIAADAFHVLTQENKEAIRLFEEQAGTKRQTLNQEIEDTRAKWQRERKQTEISRKESEELAKKAQAKAEADFAYELERKRKVEIDAYNEKKRKLERELAETQLARERVWAEREKALTDRKADHDANLARLVAIPQEQDEAVKKAREEAIKDAYNEAKVKAELLEKEVEANRKVYDLQIQTLDASLLKYGSQIENLTTQLQTANREVQELALRAIEGSTGRQSKSSLAREGNHGCQTHPRSRRCQARGSCPSSGGSGPGSRPRRHARSRTHAHEIELHSGYQHGRNHLRPAPGPRLLRVGPERAVSQAHRGGDAPPGAPLAHRDDLAPDPRAARLGRDRQHPAQHRRRVPAGLRGPQQDDGREAGGLRPRAPGDPPRVGQGEDRPRPHRPGGQRGLRQGPAARAAGGELHPHAEARAG
jgi:hypothetical protein